jgi:hypothetical protein
MALTAVGGGAATPLPVQLAEQELSALGPFLNTTAEASAVN